MPDKPWRPTAGKDSLLDVRLNLGTWSAKRIFIHLTSALGYDAIMQGRQINALRGGGKIGVYLSPSSQAFSPADAFTLLFFENERYRLSATHCLVFAFKTDVQVKEQPISHGSWVKEIIYEQDITFKNIEILYNGANKFAMQDKQDL